MLALFIVFANAASAAVDATAAVSFLQQPQQRLFHPRNLVPGHPMTSLRRSRGEGPEEEQHQPDVNIVPTGSSFEAVEAQADMASRLVVEAAPGWLPEVRNGPATSDQENQGVPIETLPNHDGQDIPIDTPASPSVKNVSGALPRDPQTPNDDLRFPAERQADAQQANNGASVEQKSDMSLPDAAPGLMLDDPNPDGPRDAVAGKLVLEMAIYVDPFQWRKAMVVNNNERGNAEYQIERLSSALAGQAQAMYNLPNFKPPIDIKVVSVNILEDLPRQMKECQCSNSTHIIDANAYLHAFRMYLKEENVKWDTSILITGQLWHPEGESYDVLGAAGGQACDDDPPSAAWIVSFDGATAPHEIFHLLGMSHTWEHPQSSWTGDEFVPSDHFVWSAQKIFEYRTYVLSPRADCLRHEDFHGPLARVPTYRDPGKQISPEDQCLYQDAGSISHFYYDSCGRGSCKKLQSGEDVGSHFTMYKTSCGHGNYCEASLMEWNAVSKCKAPGDDYELEEKYNFAFGVCGNANYDLGDAQTVGDIKECGDKCEAEPQCKAFGYVQGVCKLKSHNCFEDLAEFDDKNNKYFIKDFD